MPSKAKDRAAATSFDQMFRATARRVLKRHGVPSSRIESEIDRLRQVEPAFSGPTFGETATDSAGGIKH